MTEVPELPLDQVHQRVVGWWIGNYYGSIGYVAKKLGKKGVREFQDLGARQVAATFKQMGLVEPEEVAVAVATNEKNLFGSEVSVRECEGKVELIRERCALLQGARAFSRLGASLLAKEHCRNCSETHWRKVFSEMGMELQTENTESGCIMSIVRAGGSFK
ncbi:MAG TPA: hypothetical protein PLI05_07720 [Methanotrichaceae archaeon]|nr:hypothetical protein [Methanotrichaceae archaeon]HQI91504.1 hypothetical protein [Methanotrichaceae archaeon]HQJ28842.1 hypothetical protein [Methanotrichaceae archaeon]